MRELIEASRGRVHSLPVNKSDDFFRPLSSDEESRRRFRLTESEYNKKFKLGPRWGPALYTYYYCLPADYKKPFYNIIRVLRITDYKSDLALRETLTELTTVAKKYDGMLQGIPAVYLQYLENLGGYADVADDDLDKSGRVWVSKHTKSEKYMSYFNRACKNVVSSIFQGNFFSEDSLTPQQFIAKRELWATQGSSDISGKILDIKSGSNLQKTKSAAAVGLTDQFFLELMDRNSKQKNKLNGKRELTKVRAVISGDMSLYLKMSYVSYYLEKLIKSDKSPMFSNKRVNAEIWQKLIAESGNSRLFKFPFDQKSFDQNISKEMVLEVVKELKEATMKVQSVPRYLSVWFDKILYALDGGVLVLNSGEEIPYEGGVMSGWRWTALLDTIINMIQLQTWVLFEQENNQYTVSLASDVYFGDDIAAAFTNRDDCVRYTEFMLNNGYVANPKKIFVSQSRNEFLRKLITEDGAKGYPARAINTIFWRNPVNADPKQGMIRASEQMNSWMTLGSRGMDWLSVGRLMVRDLSKGNGVSKSDVRKLLSTPKAAGGLGYNINVESDWLGIKQSSTLEEIEKNRQPVSDLRWVEKNGSSRAIGGLRGLDKYWGITPLINATDLGQWNARDFKKDWMLEDANKYKKWVTRSPAYIPVVISGVSWNPVWRKDVPRFLMNGYIARWFRELRHNDFFVKMNQLVENGDIGEKIYKMWGIRSYYDWLSGIMTSPIPTIPLCDGSQVSGLMSQAVVGFALSLLNRRRNFENLTGKFCSIEVQLQKNFQKFLGSNKVIGR